LRNIIDKIKFIKKIFVRCIFQFIREFFIFFYIFLKKISKKFKNEVIFIIMNILVREIVMKTFLDKNGLIKIPEEVKAFLNMDSGDALIWYVAEENGKRYAIIECEPSPFKKLCGRMNNPELTYNRLRNIEIF